MKKRKIISVIAFMLIVTVITVCLGRIFSRKSDVAIWKQFYDVENDTMDVVLIGSSLVGSAIDPYQLGVNTDCNVYGMSVAGQSYCFHPAFVKEVLKSQSPKLIIVEVFRYRGGAQTSLDAALNSTSGMKMSIDKLKCMLKLPLIEADHRVELFFPLLAHHNRWGELSKEDYLNKVEHSRIQLWRDEGHHASNEQRDITLFATNEVGVINDEAKSYIDELCELASEADCELLFFNPPNPEYIENDYKNFNAIYQYLESKNVNVIDCNRDKLFIDSIDEYMDFCDYHHTSLSGTYKTTAYLAKYLNETYQFENRDFKHSEYYQDYLTYKEELLKAQSIFSMYAQCLYCDQWKVTYRIQEGCSEKQIIHGLSNFDAVTQQDGLFDMLPDMESCLAQIVVSDKDTGEVICASYVSKENANIVNHIN